MAKKKQGTEASVDFTNPAANILNNPVANEVSDSFLEYAYYVIGSRALPDARDGLKPVHRRILYTMSEMGLKPDHAYVKVARIGGEVMGKLHPHGDLAITDSLVRMAQDFSMSVPFVDGHGNFGSLDSGPAAARYIEARMAPAALSLVTSVHENTVDMVPNYDGLLLEPSVLPAAFPNLLVNGSEGIAVGMATKMVPHNVLEVIAAAQLLLANPNATLKDVMKVLPGPDLPGGCLVVASPGIKEAYETGKGSFKMRAVTRIEPIEGSRGRNQIIVTALPYGVGPEKIVEAVRKGIVEKKISFVSDIIDLSEGVNLSLHIELKTGVNPESALASLLNLTPLEQGFAISNLALVDGQPKTLTLIDLLTVWLEFRKTTVLRRSEFRRTKATDRLHLVDGLLVALNGIDLVVKTIRAAADTAKAKAALMKHKSLKLTDIQASHVLEMPLRRLTSMEVNALLAEAKKLAAEIEDLTDIIESESRLHSVVNQEMSDVASDMAANVRVSRVIADTPGAVPIAAVSNAAPSADAATASGETVTWNLTSAGLLTADGNAPGVIGSVTSNQHVMLLCADGVAVKVPVTLMDGMKASVAASRTSPVVGVAGVDEIFFIGTSNGVIKAMKPEWPLRGDEHSFINLSEGDTVLWAGTAAADANAVFITSDASLLTFPVSAINPQGRSSAGVAGIRLADGVNAKAFMVTNEAEIITITDGGKGKSTPLTDYPSKGRGTGGVRCQKFNRGDTALTTVIILPAGATLANSKGKKAALPAAGKRDGAGTEYQLS
jgi:DNA gyrase subunit A